MMNHSNIVIEPWGIIVNPIAGNWRLRRMLKHFYGLLDKTDIPVRYRKTAFAGHAADLAKEFVESGVRQILVIGGDGTLNEVVNGIYRATSSERCPMTLALLPCGSGNDWARYWHMRRDYRRLAAQMQAPRTVSVDIGKITTYLDENPQISYFINGCGFGFDGLVVHLTNALKRRFGGHAWLYKLSVLIALTRARSSRMQLTADNSHFDGDIYTIAVGNGCYSGGGLKQVPTANPTDGLLHITAMQRIPLRLIPHGLRLLFAGCLPEHPCAHSFVTTRFDVQSTTPLHTETDGRILPRCTHYTVEIIPHALHILQP